MRSRLRGGLSATATLLLMAAVVLAAMVSIWLVTHRGTLSAPPAAPPTVGEHGAPRDAPPIRQPSAPGQHTPSGNLPAGPSAPSKETPTERARAQARTAPTEPAEPISVQRTPAPTPERVPTESPAAPETTPPHTPELNVAPGPLPGVAGPPPAVIPPKAPSRLFEEASAALARVLDRYEQAYDNLDPDAAAAIWPSVDLRALTRAFARLQSQNLQLSDCTFAVSDTDAAARCAGVLQYARRIGDTTPKTERHVWTIEFVRAGASWQIVRVTAQ